MTKKIVHVTEALGGGVAHLLSHVCREQVESNYDVTLVHSLRSSSPDPQELYRLFPPPISRILLPMVTRIAPYSDARALIHMIGLLESLKPDIVHLHSSKAGILGRVAGRILGLQARMFYSPHGLSFLRKDVSVSKRQLYRWLEVLGAKLGGAMIASSESEERLITEKLFCSRVHLVENGIDFSSIIPRRDSNAERARIVSTGRITFAKAPWRFRRVADALRSEAADFSWIGDGELRATIDAASADNVSVTGWAPNARQVFYELAGADIFLLPSLWEGMPISLIEAQAVGLPAVVSDVVGCRDVVVDGETGFICGDDRMLIDRTRLLVRNKKLREEMGEAARDMASKRFSVKRMHDELLRVYRLEPPHR